MNISSKNETILLVSDPHQEVDKLERIMKAEGPDKIVCLGDWWDSHIYDSASDVEKTNRFLKNHIFKRNFVTCFGNHDLPYLFDNYNTMCSGWSSDKKKTIKNFFGEDYLRMRDKFRWYVWVDDFLCTHAGLSSAHLSPNQLLGKKELSEWLERKTLRADNDLKNNFANWLFMAGHARGGSQPMGGITWLDFNWEFEPIDGLNQIVGHTAGRSIRRHHSDGDLSADLNGVKNLCLDCHLNQYLLICNGKLEVKNYADL